MVEIRRGRTVVIGHSKSWFCCRSSGSRSDDLDIGCLVAVVVPVGVRTGCRASSVGAVGVLFPEGLSRRSCMGV